MTAVLETIRGLLEERGIPFREVHHEPIIMSVDDYLAVARPTRVLSFAI